MTKKKSMPLTFFKVLAVTTDGAGLYRVKLKLESLQGGAEGELTVTVSEYGLAKFRRFADVANQIFGIRLWPTAEYAWEEMIDQFKKQ